MDAVIVGKDGKWYSSKNAVLNPDGSVVAKHFPSSVRYRATVVVMCDGKLLLVRDKGRRDFSMPGGGFKKGESTVQAGVRELCEEVGGLTVLSVERLRHCDIMGQRAMHKVCRVVVEGTPYVRQYHEIDKVVWWDMESPLPVQGHVEYVLGVLRGVHNG